MKPTSTELVSGQLLPVGAQPNNSNANFYDVKKTIVAGADQSAMQPTDYSQVKPSAQVLPNEQLKPALQPVIQQSSQVSLNDAKKRPTDAIISN